MLDTGHGGNAIVHRDQQGWPPQPGMDERGIDHLGGQPIAVLEAVGHEVIDRGAEHPQPLHGERNGGGTITVVIAHDQDRLVIIDGGADACHGSRQAQQCIRGQQGAQIQFQLVGVTDAACCQQPRHQGVDPRLQQGLACAQIHRAGMEPDGRCGWRGDR